MRNKKALIIVIVVVVVVTGATLLAGVLGGSSVGTGTTSAANSQAADESAASSTVAAFGQTLQQVSIMAPNAADLIASTYGPYVAPALLQQWEADPRSAPGRVVSSPWPDHIKIDSIAPQGSGYVVNGELVFMTSNEVENGGNAGTTPVVIQLTNANNGKWQIVAFQGQNSQ